MHPQLRENEATNPEKKVAIQPNQPNTQARAVGRTKEVCWNVSNLNTDTLFVLDFKANKAFGFSPEVNKGRLASKHPELIRYLPDGHDKDWMIQQNILSPQNKNLKFLMLVHDEVVKISQTEEYQNKVQINLAELDGFKVPGFILQKMKIFFTELSLRSQSFLVNSQYLSNVSTASATGTSTESTCTLQTPVVNQMPKPKSSLSSSHATLSALLSASPENTAVPTGVSAIQNLPNIPNTCPESNDAVIKE